MTETAEAKPDRETLVALCEAAIRPERVWTDRDSASAHQQLGAAWALLKAGCDYEIDKDLEPTSNGRVLWLLVYFRGFQAFELGEDEVGKQREQFYLPTQQRLDEVGPDGDWYC